MFENNFIPAYNKEQAETWREKHYFTMEHENLILSHLALFKEIFNNYRNVGHGHENHDYLYSDDFIKMFTDAELMD